MILGTFEISNIPKTMFMNYKGKCIWNSDVKKAGLKLCM